MDHGEFLVAMPMIRVLPLHRLTKFQMLNSQQSYNGSTRSPTDNASNFRVTVSNTIATLRCDAVESFGRFNDCDAHPQGHAASDTGYIGINHVSLLFAQPASILITEAKRNEIVLLL